MISTYAPGRVNDHTDYTGGLCLPMAIQFGTTVEGERGGTEVRLVSSAEPRPAVVALDVDDPASVEPRWARYVAGVVAELRPDVGFVGRVSTTLPIGGGLSSSAALEVAVALALGFEGSGTELARRCRRAEHLASGVPCGIMDQLASVAGVDGHLLRVDCRDESVRLVELPDGVVVVAVDSQQRRTLVGSAYARRRAECGEIEARIGPLRDADSDDVSRVGDPTLRRRAQHVVSENRRVDAFVDALRARDLGSAGALMGESHRSLSEDFEVSTPAVDALVAAIVTRPGVWGARLTGGGFGGTIVVLAEPGAEVDGVVLLPAAGARIQS